MQPIMAPLKMMVTVEIKDEGTKDELTSVYCDELAEVKLKLDEWEEEIGIDLPESQIIWPLT
jgi:hypothetical protein